MARTLGLSPKKDDLVRLYWDEGLSTSEIGDLYGAHKNTIKYWLAKFDIPRRRGGEWRRGKTFKGRYPYKHAMPERQELERLYFNEHLTLRDLAKHYRVSVYCVDSWFKRLGIDRRLSFEPYTLEFNRQFKELIRMRDGYKCQKCGLPQEECYSSLPVHHIDYNKVNCLPSNLITLCPGCNSKVNRDREYWQTYFTNLLQSRGWGNCGVDTETSLREKVHPLEINNGGIAVALPTLADVVN